MLIFLFGNDTFRSREKLSEINNKFLSHSSGSVSSVVDYEENAPQSLASSIGETGLFTTKQLLIVENAVRSGSKEQQADVLAVLKKRKDLETDNDIVLIFRESYEPPKNNALYKYLIANTKKQQFAPLEGAQLSRWAIGYVGKLSPKTKISSDALQLLISSTGNNLHLLSNELSKLVSLRPEGDVTAKDIESMTIFRSASTIFETIEAMFAGKKDVALKLFHEQLTLGTDPFYLLSMYVYQTRNLLKVGDFFWSGLQDRFAIAKAAGLHPFVVQKALGQLRGVSKEKLLSAHSSLADIDLAAKTGKTDLVLALDTFIVSL